MRPFANLLLVFAVGILIDGCGRNDNETIEASGTIEGTDVTVSAEVAGKILEVRVDEGSYVTKGDTLLTFDDIDYQIQLRQQLANKEAAEAQYELAIEGSRREDIAYAEATFKNAEADYKRMKDLLALQSITQKQYDDALARYITAQQTYEKVSRGSRPAEIRAARARRDQTAAQVDQLRKKVSDCRVLAPTNGTVTLRAVEPGELVTMGSNLLRITNLERVKLTLYVGEDELGKVKLGQQAKIRVDSYPDKVYNGKVVYISPVAEFTPKNVQTKEERTKLVFGVKIEADNLDGALKPGMPADAEILLMTKPGN
jgi:HlyD family secretion protein